MQHFFRPEGLDSSTNQQHLHEYFFRSSFAVSKHFRKFRFVKFLGSVVSFADSDLASELSEHLRTDLVALPSEHTSSVAADSVF